LKDCPHWQPKIEALATQSITPSLPALAGGRGNWGKALPEGFEDPL